MSEVTLQELFNQAWKGLAAQGWERSMGSRSYTMGCAYRGAGGRRCAVGHLIGDDEYHVYMEGAGVDTLHSLLPGRLLPHAEDLCDMQYCHDDARSPEDMRRRLREFAIERGLSVPEVGHAE